MANLETLELTVTGSSTQATQGIDLLTRSLSALHEGLSSTYQMLQKVNSELKTLKSFGSLKLPSMADVTAASKVGSGRSSGGGGRKLAPYPTGEDRSQQAIQMFTSASKAELLTTKVEGMANAFVENARAGKLSEVQMADTALSIQRVVGEINKLEGRTDNTPSMAKKLSEGFHEATKNVDKFWGRIKRIATTMLIRSAIRGLIKAVKEGVSNLYQWSNAVGGKFAKSMDTARAAAATLKNSIGAALAPVISSLIPLFNSVTHAVISAFNAINQFIALLSGQSSWTKATEQAADATDDLASSAGGAGKAAKEMLAAFDELNVIGQESGGGGGGSTKLTEDFSGMFEEIDTFDSKIRNLVAFIKDNIESIKAMAVATGAAILAWKLGNSFAEKIPILSKIMGYAATGLSIAITLQATWALTTQYLNTGDEGWLFASAMATAVGTGASWLIARQLIGGGAATYAASITLALAAVTDVVANIQHTDVSALSKESVLTNIKAGLEGAAALGLVLKATGAAAALGTMGTLFAVGGGALAIFAVATLIKLATQDYTTIEWDGVSLTEKQIDAFVQEKMFTVRPNTIIELTPDAIRDLKTDEQAISEKISGMLGYLEVVNLGLATSDDYAHLKEQVLGTNGLIDKVNGWINSAETADKLALKIVPRLFGSDSKEQSEWYQSDISGWNAVKSFVNDLGRQLADEMVEGEKGEVIAKRPERVATLLEEITRISEIIAGTDIATEAQIDLELGLKDLDSTSFNTAMKQFNDYKEQMNNAAEEWANTMYANKTRMVTALKEALEIDPNNAEIKAQLAKAEADLAEFKEEFNERIASQVEDWTLPGKNLLEEWVKKNFNPNSFTILWDETGLKNMINSDGLEAALKQIFEDNRMDMTNINVSDVMEIGGWDLLNADLQQKILKYVGVNADTVAELKNTLKFSATDILKVSDWDEFTTTEKFAFINAIKEAFGATEAINAAKNAGINIGDLVSQGLNSSDSKIKKEAQDWNKIIKDNAGKKVTVPVEADKAKITKAGQNAKSWFNTAFGKKIQATVEATKSSITKLKNDVNSAIGGTKIVKPTIEPTIASNFVTKLSTNIKDSIKSAVSKANISVPVRVQTNSILQPYAAGGFPTPGQLFIAREAGAEMVGSIGNQTAVANNDQIVEGISSGVARANEEQNALLRRQNELLYAILQNSGNSGVPGASAALGRTVKQSLDMYSALVGG